MQPLCYIALQSKAPSITSSSSSSSSTSADCLLFSASISQSVRLSLAPPCRQIQYVSFLTFGFLRKFSPCMSPSDPPTNPTKSMHVLLQRPSKSCFFPIKTVIGGMEERRKKKSFIPAQKSPALVAGKPHRSRIVEAPACCLLQRAPDITAFI